MDSNRAEIEELWEEMPLKAAVGRAVQGAEDADHSFHVPAVAKGERYAAFWPGAFFLAFAVFYIVVGCSWAAPFFLAAQAGTIWTTWRGFRLKTRGFVFDAEGVGPAEEGERLWALSWRDYGGFRPTTATVWERLRFPERGGYEVLDASGQRSFYILLPKGGSSTSHLSIAAREELRRHLPLGAKDPCAPIQTDARPPRLAVVLVSVPIALVGGYLARLALAEPLSRFFIPGLLGSLFGMGAAVVALAESVRIVRWARGWRPKPVQIELPALPEEGPALSRHRARHERQPIALEEGRRYRTVEPDRRRRELAAGAKAGWLIPITYVIGLAYGASGFTEPKIALLSLFGFLFFAGMATALVPQVITARRLLVTVDDVLWVHDGALIAIRPDKNPLTLPLPTATDRQAVRRRGWTGATDVLTAPNGDRYALDRTRLYAAPHEVD